MSQAQNRTNYWRSSGRGIPTRLYSARLRCIEIG